MTELTSSLFGHCCDCHVKHYTRKNSIHRHANRNSGGEGIFKGYFFVTILLQCFQRECKSSIYHNNIILCL